MKTTKFLNYVKNNYAEILFFLSVFFTSCLFMDTASHIGKSTRPIFFFMDFRFVWLKVALAIILPLLATLLCYIKTKNIIYMADAAALVMTIFSVGFVLDYFTLKVLWRIEKTVVIYHLCYALLAYFTVFITVSAIGWLKKEGIKGYSVFCHTFFIGFASVCVVCFVTIYFLNRSYGVQTEPINLIPFQGEFRFIREHGFTKQVIRDIGNVFFFTAMAMMLSELVKKHKFAFGMLIPVVLSCLMEVFQYYAKCGDTDIDDIIANVLGTIVGLLIYKFIVEKIKEKELC
ncbi:MAG: VanZ family protein [Eubacterium sp.]